jgi:hypothetical protein
MEKMFEIATRKKFRFPFRGMVSVEDLWDCTPENLDTVFKALNAQKKVANEESLLSAATDADVELNIKIEIVKHIVAVKLAEIRARKEAKEKKEQKQKIMAILETKQNEALGNKSIEELQAMLKDLD